MTRERLHVWAWLRRPGGLIIRDWVAITIGAHIFAWRNLSASELAHELAHVHQWRIHGWTFPFTYFADSLRASRAGRHWYRDNRFEVEARAAVPRSPQR